LCEENNGKTFRFDVCSQCKTICCQDAKPPLTRQRQKIIEECLVKQQISVMQPFTCEQYTYPSVDEHLFCSLYNKQTGKCQVHQVKPETCCAGPVTFDINFKTGKLEFYLKKTEICALAGVLYKNPELLQCHLDAAKREITQLVEQLSADELKAIVKIDEPFTFKICEENLAEPVAKKLGLSGDL
jgi:Fe-S-cluster containining protein